MHRRESPFFVVIKAYENFKNAFSLIFFLSSSLRFKLRSVKILNLFLTEKNFQKFFKVLFVMIYYSDQSYLSVIDWSVIMQKYCN